jgi:hypothetical protein
MWPAGDATLYPGNGGKNFLSKSVIFYRTTRRHIADDNALPGHRREIFKSCIIILCREATFALKLEVVLSSETSASIYPATHITFQKIVPAMRTSDL